MPIDIASRGTSVRGYQTMRASSTSPTCDAFQILKINSIAREPTIASAVFCERRKGGRNFEASTF
jgi:hypothetical protein